MKVSASLKTTCRNITSLPSNFSAPLVSCVVAAESPGLARFATPIAAHHHLHPRVYPAVIAVASQLTLGFADLAPPHKRRCQQCGHHQRRPPSHLPSFSGSRRLYGTGSLDGEPLHPISTVPGS